MASFPEKPVAISAIPGKVASKSGIIPVKSGVSPVQSISVATEPLSDKPSIFYDRLREIAEPEYQKFSAKLTPNLKQERILGVRIPLIRALTKQLLKESPQQVAEFLRVLPHYYFEENNLHGLLIAEQKDFTQVIKLLEQFLPQVDNWATCDIISPKVFKKHQVELLEHIKTWISAEHEYTIRFGIGMLLKFYLDDNFHPDYLKWVAAIRNPQYYVKMMVAWYFATALTKQYELSLPLIEQHQLEPWTHNKAIQKARESRRISPERKEYLFGLRVKK